MGEGVYPSPFPLPGTPKWGGLTQAALRFTCLGLFFQIFLHSFFPMDFNLENELKKTSKRMHVRLHFGLILEPKIDKKSHSISKRSRDRFREPPGTLQSQKVLFYVSKTMVFEDRPFRARGPPRSILGAKMEPKWSQNASQHLQKRHQKNKRKTQQKHIQKWSPNGSPGSSRGALWVTFGV